jgi:hypothetical protein
MHPFLQIYGRELALPYLSSPAAYNLHMLLRKQQSDIAYG